MYINTKKYKMDKKKLMIFWAILPQKTHFFDKMGQNGQKGAIYQRVV